MSAADDPKTQVQTSPSSPQTQVTTDPIAVSTAPPSAAPVKVTKPRMSPEAFDKITARLDAALVALVLVFAFVTACFAVRNSDFFQYLAIGRLIAHGEYHIGKDPFSFATDGVRWVDHSWLTSHFLYLIYNFGAAGAVAIIVLKGVAIAALAGILLVLSRNPGQRWLIPAACTAVAILALSARVLMQPVVVSYFFLGLTLLVLRWPYLWPETKTATPRSYRCYWLLAPLFALWVNCDQWFFLGPVTAGLYWLGEYLQDTLATDRTQTRPAGELRTLGYAVLVGAAACLLNPQHVYALTLPPQLGLSAAATAASKDKQLEALFVSPLDKGYWVPSVGLSAAGIAYFPLLVAGIASFVLSYNTLRYWRVFLFLAFGVLSVYHARAIPFFAVIAGPITSLNFLDYVASRFGGEIEPDRLRDRWAIGRAVALLAAVALVVCSIPGWTQAQPYASRHLGWAVVPDESLVRTCTKMAEWRRDGLIKPDARWFNTSPDVLNYMSWYCPGERGFLDLRLGLFDATAADYVRVREELLALNPPPDTDRNQPPVEEWPAVLKKENVDYVIIHYPYAPFLFHPLQRLYRDPAWTPLSLDGHTLVFAWNKDAEAFQRNQRMQFDLNPAAFGPDAMPGVVQIGGTGGGQARMVRGPVGTGAAAARAGSGRRAVVPRLQRTAKRALGVGESVRLWQLSAKVRFPGRHAVREIIGKSAKSLLPDVLVPSRSTTARRVVRGIARSTPQPARQPRRCPGVSCAGTDLHGAVLGYAGTGTHLDAELPSGRPDSPDANHLGA